MGRGAIPARDALPRQIRPRRTHTGKPPLEGRWHGGAVTERCAAAQRRRRGSALCTRREPVASFRCGNTSPAELDGEFYGASPLGISACADIPRILQSVSLRLTAPLKGSLPSQASGTCGSADCHAHGGLRADVGIGPYGGKPVRAGIKPAPTRTPKACCRDGLGFIGGGRLPALPGPAWSDRRDREFRPSGPCSLR